MVEEVEVECGGRGASEIGALSEALALRCGGWKQRQSGGLGCMMQQQHTLLLLVYRDI